MHGEVIRCVKRYVLICSADYIQRNFDNVMKLVFSYPNADLKITVMFQYAV